MRDTEALCPILRIDGYFGKDYLVVSPIFTNIHQVNGKSFKAAKEERFYILSQEDKMQIAGKMGFEPAGIKVIGIKGKTLDNDQD